MPDNGAISAPKLSCVKKLIQQIESDSVYVFRYLVTVVTPMFGGSSKAGVVDADDPIKAASIRGQLRFWWRATRGAAYKTVDELRKQEVAIFGDTRTPSRVKIGVEAGMEEPKLFPAKKINKGRYALNDNLPPYALFSITDNQAQYLDNYTFSLCVRYDNSLSGSSSLKLQDLKDEVNAALWAWINFGGIGSRTRRGCGSLFCSDFSPKTNQLMQEWFSEGLNKHSLKLLATGEYREWPTLCREIHFGKPARVSQNNVMSNWKEIITTYQCFRQKRNIKDGELKRSLWPEPDSLRRIMEMSEPEHSHPFTLEQESLDYAFPRAQLGLPIITHFKRKRDESRNSVANREPYQTEILPEGKKRLASPLILKAIAQSKDSGIGAIIILNHRPLTKLTITNKESKKINNHSINVDKKLSALNITGEHIYSHLNYSKSPMKDKNDKPTSSAIVAFLASEEVRNWKNGRLNKMPNFNKQNKQS